jgi:NAD(P)H-hydrate epimerase
MKKVFSVEEIKEIESREFRKRGGDSFSLMVNAGVNCAKKIIKLVKKKPIIIVCGPGNNGGDGFIIGNYLHEKEYKVEVFCLQKKYYKGDALKAFKKLKIKTQNISKFKARKNSVIIDCIFGTGLNKPISGTLKSVILRMNKLNKIISIDIPSGINGDTGKILGCAVKAHTTLALHAKKIGHTLSPGKKFSRKIIVVDIGISKKFNYK